MEKHNFRRIGLFSFIWIIVTINISAQNNDQILKKTNDMKKAENIEFPVGYYDFNKNKAFNFQLNRFYSMGYARLEDMEAIGKRISSFDEWHHEMIKLAEQSVSENRLLNTAIYYRAAEFFLTEENPEKEILYNKFIDYFYKARANDNIKKVEIPNNESSIYTLHLQPENGEKGTIIMHAGYDGFKEELYSLMLYFYNNNYEVITFDVPWMGRSQKNKEMGLDIEWEKPIKSILDYFELDNVTLIGISMGGWLSLRAAAFEPRIKRVIASSVSYDVSQYNGILGQQLAKLFFNKFRKFTNKMITKKMQKDLYYAWFVNHLMYATNKQSPIEAFDVLMQFSEENLHSELVKQDVLIITGKEDHAIPYKMHKLQVKALTNAKSVTAKVYTKETTGQYHCQIGNVSLALVAMLDWIENNSN